MTSPRTLLRLKKRPRGRPDPAAPLEWLVTNGLGGYAAGSVEGRPLRRFHGLLVAALPAPAGRSMLVHHVEEEVERPDGSRLSLRPGPEPRPRARPMEFALSAGLPHWKFTLTDGVRLEQAVFMPHGQNTVHLRYQLIGGSEGATLWLRPWLDIRGHEHEHQTPPALSYVTTKRTPAQAECARSDLPTFVRLAVSGAQASFEAGASTWSDVEYVLERDRGCEHAGWMYAPGVFVVTLEPDRAVYLTASSEPWAHLDRLPPEVAWSIELTRREQMLGQSHPALRTAETFLLPLAADQFIIRPATREATDGAVRAAGAEPRTVIAGYPWFTDWGRDTMISLEGLTLSTGRATEARHILQTFAHSVKHGLIPNLFPEGASEGRYHTADATLWFFHALHRYEQITADRSLTTEILPVLEEIVAWHRRGTWFNIRVDDDGLLTAGVDSLPLTWMDAKMDEWVVTPRRGKPVEINALWHNALVLLEGWLVRDGRGLFADDIAREARRCREAFNRRFWNPSSGHLFDVVDGDHGDDPSCRPNQLLTLAVTHSPLDRQYWAAVLEAVTLSLLTPYGLRSLAPSHAEYKPRYFGNLRSRDAAYHQGTVWPWLIGAYVDAWLLLHPDDRNTPRALLRPLLRHLVSGACVGSISEIFDAQRPYVPRGCFAQAWSVAELIRAIVRTTQGDTNDTRQLKSEMEPPRSMRDQLRGGPKRTVATSKSSKRS